MSQLPIHFFTIVLNGQPFIDYHIEIFTQLTVPWHWHIIEGVATLTHDTGWSVSQGGQVPTALHADGLSLDGTTQSLDLLKLHYPDNISVYRKPRGEFWDGKREMISEPLKYINQPALLWQLDSDELWTLEQIQTMHSMFTSNPDKMSAWFWCWYFVGPEKIICTRKCYAQNPNQEWNRVWRFIPGMFWASHEPPILAGMAQDGKYYNVGLINPFNHAETEANGLVFQHYSYVTKAQLEFKESYYGYTGAVAAWNKLQEATEATVKLKNYFPWVTDETEIASTNMFQVIPLAKFDQANGRWQFNTNQSSSLNKMSVDVSGSATSSRSPIIIDGMFFQFAKSGVARLWKTILTLWSETEFAKQILILDRGGSAPKISGYRYRMIPEYDYNHMESDRMMLENICIEEGASLFVSTYYSRPDTFPTFQLVYDMIPEAIGLDLTSPDWVGKQYAFQHADHFACISEHTKKDLLRFHPRLSSKDIPVVYPAFDSAVFRPTSMDQIFAFHQKYEITLPYFLMVGPNSGYKNARCLFEAIGKLTTQHGFEVIIVGGTLNEADLSQIRLGCRVRKILIDDQDLCAAYSGAISLVYPSLYEGFGLPILEALASHCPVITTPFSSIPEAAGSAALYITNAQELADALAEVQKPSVRKQLALEAPAQLAKFSWDKAAKQLMGLLIQASKGNSKEIEWRKIIPQDQNLQRL